RGRADPRVRPVCDREVPRKATGACTCRERPLAFRGDGPRPAESSGRPGAPAAALRRSWVSRPKTPGPPLRRLSLRPGMRGDGTRAVRGTEESGMRWVWRAEAGGFKVEYAAVVILVATLVTAVFAFGLPTDVKVLYAEGICRIMPDSEGCDGEGQGGDQDTGGSDQDGTPGEEDGEGQAEPSPSPSAPPGGGGEDEEGDGSDSPVMEPAGAFDQEAADDYAEAQEELEEAQGKLDGADSDQVYDDLMNLLGDIVGYNDAKACLTEGDLIACLWTIVGLSPFGKGAKLVKNTPK